VQRRSVGAIDSARPAPREERLMNGFASPDRRLDAGELRELRGVDVDATLCAARASLSGANPVIAKSRRTPIVSRKSQF
jgi:hypothetical protein